MPLHVWLLEINGTGERGGVSQTLRCSCGGGAPVAAEIWGVFLDLHASWPPGLRGRHHLTPPVSVAWQSEGGHLVPLRWGCGSQPA